MKNIKAVVFDLDNTLIDRRTAFRKFCNYFIDKYFHDTSLPENKDSMIDYMVFLDKDGYYGKIKFYETLVEKWNIQNFTIHQLRDDYYKSFYKFIETFPDATETLNHLKSKYSLGIITNGHSNIQNQKIDHTKIRPFFDDIIVSGEVSIEKPDEKIFQMSCSNLKIKSSECVYVGDNYKNDVVGAHNAGMYPIWFTNDPKQIPYENSNKIQSLSELIDILG